MYCVNFILWSVAVVDLIKAAAPDVLSLWFLYAPGNNITTSLFYNFLFSIFLMAVFRAPWDVLVFLNIAERLVMSHPENV